MNKLFSETRMQKRRTFIKTSTAALAAAMILPGKMLGNKERKNIGIQLYTLREMAEDDFEGVLEIISNIGYKTVEAAGYSNRKFYGYYPSEYKKLVENYGLNSVSSHCKFNLGNVSEVIDDVITSGGKYLVLPSLPENKRQTIDDYKKLADKFNIYGQLCKNAGLTFAYHNHAFEFEEKNGIIPYNVLLENTDPELVSMELDLYWIMYGGFNPQEYFEIFPGRFKLWHVKDMANTWNMQMAPVGQGIINFKAIFRQQKLAGLEHAFVEQDDHYDTDPVLNIKSSYNYLNNLSDF